MNHSEAVTKHYLAAENSLEDGYWDDVIRETSYFANQDSPIEQPPRGEKGREVGEFDVLLINHDDQYVMYKELKTTRGDMYKASQQIERAEEFFEDTEWDLDGVTALER